MSATLIPISQQAAALRIIGATMSRPRCNACTGPTVVASSPVPSHALEMTPVRTQRFSWTSCSRARSKPAYKPRLASCGRRETRAARSGFSSMVRRYARTRAGSGCHSTYSGGSNAGKRCIGESYSSGGELELRYSGGAVPHELPVAFVDRPAFHHEVHVLQQGDVLQRVAAHRDEVGVLPRRDRADVLLLAEQGRPVQRAGNDRLHRRHAVPHHQLEFPGVGAVVHYASIGTEGDLHASLQRESEGGAHPRRDGKRLGGDRRR